MNVTKKLTGAFFTNSNCYCEKLDDAYELIRKHTLDSKRAKMWYDKQIEILWEGKL